MLQTFHDIACTICGCVCDDLVVTVEEDRIANVRAACPLAEPWFARLGDSPTRAAACDCGRSVAYEEAIQHAAEILRNCHAPLVWGLTRSSTAGQRAAIALAEQLGGTVDTLTSLNPAATLAMQNVGQSTCSLGEVKNRADLVIFWGTNPVVSHPRHLGRYSVEPPGLFVPRGRADRTVVVIDSEATETSEIADEFFHIAAGADQQFVEALRQVASGSELTTLLDFGMSDAHVRQLVERMKACRYGALFFGAGQGTNRENQAIIESLLQLVTELNQFTRFTAHYIPPSGGLSGADTVLCWQTGFPFAVNFASGYPRFDPHKFAANRLLEDGTVDACVLVGSEAVPTFSPAAQRRLREIPTIALDYLTAEQTIEASVQFTTAIYGIHAAGTAYRMDGVPIPLREVLPTSYPCDHEVLAAIAVRLPASHSLTANQR